MRELRNTVLIILFVVSLAWGAFAWLWGIDHAQIFKPSVELHRWIPTAVFVVSGVLLFWAMRYEPKLPDLLGQKTMAGYYERDGLCFMPMVRVDSTGKRTEISLYYQSRYKGECEAVIHLNPDNDAFFSHRGATAVHFAFRCRPGAFGVIHQPVAVRPEAQGELITVTMAAAVRWPRERGELVRKKPGMPCGTFNVDWARAYSQSAHELSREIELKNPVTVRLRMPENVETDIERGQWKQETISALT